MELQTVSPEQVDTIISNLHKGKSPGLDGITPEHLIYGKSMLLCSLLATVYSVILSSACVPTSFTTGLIVPVLKKSTLNPNIVKNYRPITLSCIHTKVIESLIIPSTDICDSQFGFREGRGTSFACSLLNDVVCYYKTQNSPLFIATLDAEKCFDSICHVSLFLKLIDVLPVNHWLLLYNWYSKLNGIVKWNGTRGDSFNITRGTRQGSIISPYLFNIFINQLLYDLQSSDAGARIGDMLFNSVAYADDITLFSTNIKGLQNLIDICVAYSRRWRFKFGIAKSKCMVTGAYPLSQNPRWRLGDEYLCSVDKLDILGNTYNCNGNSSSHVENRINKCRQSFYGLGNIGMSYPGATPGVQAYLYKSICQPTLTYGLESMNCSKAQMQKLDSIQGKLIKQSLGLSKRSHNTELLQAMNISNVKSIVNRNVLSLYNRIFKLETPARRLAQYFLSRYIVYGNTVPGTLLDRVVSMGESPISMALNKPRDIKYVQCSNGHVDSLRQLLFNDNFIKPYSQEHILVHLLTTAL